MGGKGRGKGGGGGGGGWGGGGGGGSKPFWRRFVDPSDDPAVQQRCHSIVQQFLQSGQPRQSLGHLTTEMRNTLRVVGPQLGASIDRDGHKQWALVRPMQTAGQEQMGPEAAVGILVEKVRMIGGQGRLALVSRQLSAQERSAIEVSTGLPLRRALKSMADSRHARAAGLGLSPDGKRLRLEGMYDEYSELTYVPLDRQKVSEALKALRRWKSRKGAAASWQSRGADAEHAVLSQLAQRPLQPGCNDDLLAVRRRLPMWQAREELSAACRPLSGPGSREVVLVLGATGCGKTTQAPQFILESCASRGEHCLILATQPRRISTIAVAERVAEERGEQVGESVGFKIRFEQRLSAATRLLFCTVGTVLRLMEGDPALGAVTHLVIDEVHERDLHTDLLLTLVRDLVRGPRGGELCVVLMSATVDPAPFRDYFGGLHVVEVPGKTNYPIEEVWLEGVLSSIPQHQPTVMRSKGVLPPLPPGMAELPGVPREAGEIRRALPGISEIDARRLADYHDASSEFTDCALIAAVVHMIERSGREGAVLCFVPGWAEIAETIKLLEASPQAARYQVFALHSRMPTHEQRQIFGPAPHGKRKVIISTVLAESSITVEDVVFVVDSGKTRHTFYEEQTGISALRTV
eukprot:TRINITY_DN5611_c1_g1_i1.p1 TRINITY_DN5611_c1_g1~~TRINITY_DN5611_c1_g1_i1.p1  ORF type:complete len:672 (+),score=180.62 TRINITY_DN5611_c1_g1_i1:113-2017(+)